MSLSDSIYPTLRESLFSPDTAPPTFDFPNISGLTLWLDAADTGSISESGGSVTQWNDKSGNNYHAVQATAANQPVTGTRTLNNQNVIDFSEPAQFLDLTTYAALRTLILQPHTTFLVGSADTTQFGAFIGSENASAANRYFIYLLSSDNLGFFAHSTAIITTPYTPGNPFVAMLGRTTDNSTVFQSLNGQVLPTAGTRSDTIISLLLGVMATNGEFDLDGIIGEVVIFDRELTLSEISEMETYLSGKWGIALP